MIQTNASLEIRKQASRNEMNPLFLIVGLIKSFLQVQLILLIPVLLGNT